MSMRRAVLAFLVLLFGASFVRHEVEEQFLLMTAEMKRRETDLPAVTLQQTQHTGE